MCGGAGCGKTLFAVQFLCGAAADGTDPGVFISFEERAEDLVANASSLGIDLDQLQSDGRILIDHIPVDPHDIVESGEYDLEGLFLRIGAAVDEVGATRIAIDTIEVLFGALRDTTLVRAELRRLFTWIKNRGLTAVITAEAGDAGRISRYGIEEYVSDCVILLDHRVREERSTRRLRVVKYRGSSHHADEYPFLISERGIAVLPVTSLDLGHVASSERVPTGVDHLDEILSGGVFRGTSVLISGPAGAGKSTFAAHFADGSCRRGERALYVSYEESASQVERNMSSVGLDLAAWVDAGLLRFETVRPTFYGLEAHLDALLHLFDDVQPRLVVIDPITSLTRAGSGTQVAMMLMRMVDMLKSRQITAVFTALTPGDRRWNTSAEVSSLVDTWLFAEAVESNGERNRVLSIIKSRGMAHSNQLTEFTISGDGIELLEPYVGANGVLTGTARLVQEEDDRARAAAGSQEVATREQALNRRRAAVDAQIAALRAELDAEGALVERLRATTDQTRSESRHHRELMGQHRWATRDDVNGSGTERP